jgi:hypothetical protein
MRQLFSAVILAMSTIPRPISKFHGRPQSDKPIKIAARFPLETSEVWEDEVLDAQLPAECEFPISEASALSSNKLSAIEKINALLSSEKIPAHLLAALSSDLGFQPALSHEDLKKIELSDPDYLERMQHFADLSKSKEPFSEIEIHGMQARVQNVDLDDTKLTPHIIEIPWLLGVSP